MFELPQPIEVAFTEAWQPFSWLGPYAPLVMLAINGFIVLFGSRLGLMLWQRQRISAHGMWLTGLLQGARVDAIQLAQICFIPTLFAPLSVIPGWWDVWQGFTAFWLVGAVTFLLFMEAATPGFVAEYDVRPNRLFVEYLKYPKEVCSMLWKGFRVHVVSVLVLMALAILLLSEYTEPWLEMPSLWSPMLTWLTWLPVLLVLALVIRSSFGHRPANPTTFALTTDNLVNSLILNSAWSVLYAIYNLKHEKKSADMYGKLPVEEMFAEYDAAHGDGRHSDVEAEAPTMRRHVPSRVRVRPLNLVIILEESMGATFVESLGGVPVTPELEKLKGQGWWFENMYATGTRSVRGIEAVISGFPPTPAPSVVKLSLSQTNFFSIASLLAAQGYHTEFIYGGEADFDNMQGFFRGNGFQSIIEQKDFEAPAFVSSWGVSDGDLLDKTHERLLALHGSGQPFFTLAFTSSNHSPFEFPDGLIELYDSEKGTDRNAVKYADHVLGRFFGQARASDYWQDTLFVVVADHDIRVRGDSLVPVRNFHIPALMLGADLEPRRIRSVASQIDIPVTALSLMGIDTQHPMPGRDLSREDANTPGRAMMQFEEHYGWLQGDELVVLRSGKPPAAAVYSAAEKHVYPVEASAESDKLARRALAHVQLASWLYRKQKYWPA
ncbi:MAG: sulfatase [Betaproteobacteria bacterium HGW-Betaproteobacteria-16]|jgi:phosphoglycerol transferase MdoB-like AlkP superfamily enzyme|nr:MAG: sulfatase [Betaproteobacteria bacterium HGW-Betaproteobacteria-16]